MYWQPSNFENLLVISSRPGLKAYISTSYGRDGKLGSPEPTCKSDCAPNQLVLEHAFGS